MMRDYTPPERAAAATSAYRLLLPGFRHRREPVPCDYLPQYHDSRDHGLWCFITCNHDTPRPAAGLTDAERRLAFAWIFTMPGAPFLYYGDELGMDYRVIPTKEGGYHRTGSRTPMQWDAGPNLGFSEGAAEDLVPARGSRRAAHRAGAGA